MGWEGFFALGVVAMVSYGLIRNYPPDALLLGGVILMALAGIITPDEAFIGFSNTGMLTVGALYVVAASLKETGTLGLVGAWILGRVKTQIGVLLRLAASVPLMSAFLNNTPIVAMFIPMLNDWSKNNRIAPSRLLIPLSYLAILGGTCTLIGTSTNLVVNGLMIDSVQNNPAMGQWLYPMGLFELSRVGVPYACIGILYLTFLGRHLLPNRADLIERLSAQSREYLLNMRIDPGCRLAGKTIADAGLRNLPGLFLLEVERNGDLISPVAPDQTLKAGDLLTFTGVVSTIVDLEKIPGLTPVGPEDDGVHHLIQRGRMLCEAVISGNSPVIGKTIRDADFRATYNAAIVAVHRGRMRLKGKVGDIQLQPGDTLLLRTGPHFVRANRNNPDFLLVSGIEDSRPIRSEKNLLALALLVLLIALMASGLVSIVTAAFLVAGLMIASRCISVADARRSIDWQTLITIAAAFGLGKGLVNSGVVEVAASAVTDLAGAFGPYAVLAGVYILTSLFTEIVTNNAAAALIFPFAVAIGFQMDLDPRPFVMAVAFAASACFMTPLGYQTNLMVYGPGGYKFTDFLKIGLPLNVILMASATVLIPLAWPF